MGLFKIVNRTYGNVPSALQSQIDGLFDQLEKTVNDKLPSSDPKEYLQGVSRTVVIASKGNGVDYASSPFNFVIGFGMGMGMDIGTNTLANFTTGNIKANQIKGFAIEPSIMVGLNFGIFGFTSKGPLRPSKFNLFINYLAVDIPAVVDGLDGHVNDFGVHLQYKIIEFAKNDRPTLFQWGGLNFTTGIDWAHMDISITEGFDENSYLTLGGFGNPNILANFSGTANVDANVSVKSVSLELSTYAHLFYIFTAFGGVAEDFNFGESTSNATINGPVAVTDTSNTLGNVSGDAVLDLGSRGEPTLQNLRWFGGAQVDSSFLKLYMQMNHNVGQNIWGINGGLRIVI